MNIGTGVGGALVSGGASQILSGVSAFLTGSQQTFNKEVLFDRAMPVLLDQMVATRTAVKVRIFKGMGRSMEEYTLSNAMEDVETYFRAGSIPGSVTATSEDASKKKDEAEDKLAKLRVSQYTFDMPSEALSKLIWPEGDRRRPSRQTLIGFAIGSISSLRSRTCRSRSSSTTRTSRTNASRP